MKCFNQESVLHVRLEQTVQDRAVGIERRFIRQVAHGVPVPQELQLGRNSSSCSQKRSSTGKNGSTGSTAEKSPGPSVGVPPSRATACRSRSIRPEKCCAAGGVTGGLQLPLQRSGLHGVEAVMRTPLPGQNGGNRSDCSAGHRPSWPRRRAQASRRRRAAARPRRPYGKGAAAHAEAPDRDRVSSRRRANRAAMASRSCAAKLRPAACACRS